MCESAAVAVESPFPVVCPHAPDGQTAWALRVRHPDQVFPALQSLRGRADFRCLLLVAEPGVPVTKLRKLAAKAERLFSRPVRVVRDGATPCLCGAVPACRRQKGDPAQADLSAWVGDLADRQDSLVAAIEAAFRGLPERSCHLVHEWAHRHEPTRPGRPIFIRTLANLYDLKERQVYRILAAARELNPLVFARIKHIREHRLTPAKTYRVDD